MSYNVIVTVVLERETLTGMDAETRDELGAVADAYLSAPGNLKAAIVKAGRKGDKPADIHRAIKYAYTYDYVAELVREDRKRRSQS